LLGLDSNFFYIGNFYSKDFQFQKLNKKINEENNKEKIQKFSFFKIYMKMHMASSNKKYYELFFFKKFKNIKIGLSAH